MPIPGGDITSTETWSGAPVEEVIEEELPDENSDDTEQA